MPLSALNVARDAANVVARQQSREYTIYDFTKPSETHVLFVTWALLFSLYTQIFTSGRTSQAELYILPQSIPPIMHHNSTIIGTSQPSIRVPQGLLMSYPHMQLN